MLTKKYDVIVWKHCFPVSAISCVSAAEDSFMKRSQLFSRIFTREAPQLTGMMAAPDLARREIRARNAIVEGEVIARPVESVDIFGAVGIDRARPIARLHAPDQAPHDPRQPLPEHVRFRQQREHEVTSAVEVVEEPRLHDDPVVEEAATLPCAGVTAWVGLMEQARIGPGSAVLAMGTGIEGARTRSQTQLGGIPLGAVERRLLQGVAGETGR